MRKGFTVLLLVIVLLASGCQVKVVQSPKKQPTSVPGVQTPQSSTVQPTSQPQAQNPPQPPAPTTENKLTKTGVYLGLADNYTIEVSIDGKPMALRLSDEVKTRFEALKLKKDDKIEVVYAQNSSKQLVISEIRAIK